jgi:ubiquinone/menaquinone biosynthesis C-methylase UbiE
MLLNRVEKALMNNPVRASLQRRYEAPLLERLGGRVPAGTVLELGCGRGVGTEILFERFGASTVFAFDLDPAMVREAHARLASAYDGRALVTVGDAAAIPAPANRFDAVFDFGIVHHVPRWRGAVSEVRRVLKTGGRFYFEEVTRQALNRWVYRTFLEHPTEDRFSSLEFLTELEKVGLRVIATAERFFGDFVFGVAQKI